jgi:hypothetical protein
MFLLRPCFRLSPVRQFGHQRMHLKPVNQPPWAAFAIRATRLYNTIGGLSMSRSLVFA